MQGDTLGSNCNVSGKIGNLEWVMSVITEYKFYELASKLYVGTKERYFTLT